MTPRSPSQGRRPRGRFLDGDAGVVLLQVLEADLQALIPSTRDDVLPGLLHDALHHGVGLGQPLELN